MISWSGSVLAGCGLGFCVCNLAAASLVESVAPLGLAPGASTTLKIRGKGLSGQAVLNSFFWNEASSELVSVSWIPGSDSTGEGLLRIPVKLDAGFQSGIVPLRLTLSDGKSEMWLGFADGLKSLSSDSSHDSATNAMELVSPVAVDGVILEAKSQHFRFRARKGERRWIEIVAQRIGSPLDALLVITGPGGKTVLKMDDSPEGGADPVALFRAPATGIYGIQVSDGRYMGGPDFRYRLRLQSKASQPLGFAVSGDPAASKARANWVREVEPNDEPNQAVIYRDDVNLMGTFGKPGDRDWVAFEIKKDERWFANARTRSLGSLCDVSLRWTRADGGPVVEMDATRGDEGCFTNKFDKAGVYRLEVRELTGRGGTGSDYELQVGRVRGGFTLETETDEVVCSPGGQWELEIKAKRFEFEGPIELMASFGQGSLAVTNQFIGAKTNSTKLRMSPAATHPAGESRWVTIEGRAIESASGPAVRVSTLPALKKRFPMLLYPPSGLDGPVSIILKRSNQR